MAPVNKTAHVGANGASGVETIKPPMTPRAAIGMLGCAAEEPAEEQRNDRRGRRADEDVGDHETEIDRGDGFHDRVGGDPQQPADQKQHRAEDRSGRADERRALRVDRAGFKRSLEAQGDQRGQRHESRREESRSDAARIDQAMTQFGIERQAWTANRRPTTSLPPTE